MAERKINTSKELLDQAIDDLRNLSKRLNTEYVSRQSLSESLTFQLNLIQKTGVYATALEVHGAERDMEPEKKLIVFRIAQEAFNNIIKHARARNIFVTMMYLADELLLKIEDDGAGFEADNLSSIEISQKGIGIYNMYYRAGLIGGRFSIQSQPGKGTVAQLTLPLSY
jgi:signal transduction histidine kinase